MPLEIGKGYRGPIRMGTPLRKNRPSARIDGEVPLDASQFTFRQERMILSDFYVKLWCELTKFVSPQDVPLWSAVFWGHLNGQPMNASKLANVTGLPRSTVRRRLNAMIADGKVLKTSGSPQKRIYFVPGPMVKRTRAHPIHPVTERCKALIIATGIKLAKLAT
jgi:hypothetical protein